MKYSSYFCLGPVSEAYGNVDVHTRYRLRAWLRRNRMSGLMSGVWNKVRRSK